MTKPAMAANAAALPEETDEVVVLAARLGAAVRRDEDLQSKDLAASRQGNCSAEIYFQGAIRHQYDEVDALRDMIASTRAKSLTGAAAQIVEAISRISKMADLAKEWDSEFLAMRDMRSAERLLYSALAVVDGLAERKLVDVCGPDFDDPHHNPWLPVEERCPTLKAVERAAD